MYETVTDIEKYNELIKTIEDQLLKAFIPVEVALHYNDDSYLAWYKHRRVYRLCKVTWFRGRKYSVPLVNCDIRFKMWAADNMKSFIAKMVLEAENLLKSTKESIAILQNSLKEDY